MWHVHLHIIYKNNKNTFLKSTSVAVVKIVGSFVCSIFMFLFVYKSSKMQNLEKCLIKLVSVNGANIV